MPRSFSVPGRVNLMGDHTDYNQGFCLPVAINRWCTVTIGDSHTDYNDGFVLPVAIDRECVLEVSPADDGFVRARSHQLPGVVVVAADGSDDPRAVEPAWGAFVAGAVRVLAARGAAIPGADLAVSSSVPAGAGLSSSSALSVALLLGLADTARVAIDPIEAARLALAAEVEATGVPGGLMDQLTGLLGRAGHALLIDCREPTVTPVPIAAMLAIVVVHCGVPRTLAGSDYAARRAECEAVAARLGLRALRDATAEQVVDEPRARHVVAENARVHETADALVTGDLEVLGPLLLASHASLRDDYGVSTRELDALVDALVASGAAGARLTGAGFGGCVVALTSSADAGDVLDRGCARYQDATGIVPHGFVAVAVDGAATSARGAAPSSARTRPR